MGSQSWLALPESSRPFPKCINIILSTKMEQPEGMDDVYVCRSWEAMEDLLRSKEIADRRDRIWIHGGNTVYLLVRYSKK
jgi:dihydrofolate reductase